MPDLITWTWPVTIVDACLRDGAGGSPTAVLEDDSMFDDHARSRLASVMGASHAVLVDVGDRELVRLRFFTAAGELPACGHGTVAALAFLATGDRELRTELRTAAGSLTGTAIRDQDGIAASYDPGIRAVREATSAERDLARDTLGIESKIDATRIHAATLGRTRLLVLPSRSGLSELTPNLERPRAGCELLGLLAGYVYTMPSPSGRLSARMFAPSIGVPEDVANANSTACLAALLAHEGTSEITVDMGDSLGSPATITASAERDDSGTRVRVGGRAKISRTRLVSITELDSVD